MQETWVWSLGWADSLEEGMAAHSSILAWRTTWTEEPGELQSMWSQRARHNWASKHASTDVRVGPWSRLRAEELMLLNWGAGEDFESPLDCKEIKPVSPKENQPWIFIGKSDAEAEAPVLWPPDAKSPFIGKDPDAGKDWRQEEKRTTEDELVGWHHWLNGHEFEQTLGDGEGQGSLACCSPWSCKESDIT